jgi:hypothetical protein
MAKKPEKSAAPQVQKLDRSALHQWRFIGEYDDPIVIVGDFELSLDAEGFVTTPIPNERVEASLKASPMFELVAMNNDALWQKRLEESRERVRAAANAKLEAERSAIRAAEFLRLVEEQHKQLEEEQARFKAALEDPAQFFEGE